MTKEDKVEKLIIRYLSQKDITPKPIETIESIIIDRQKNKKDGTTYTGFTIAKLKDSNRESTVKKVCIFIKVHKDLLINSAHLSYFEDHVTTPISLATEPFNSTLRAERMDKVLSTNRTVSSSKIKI